MLLNGVCGLIIVYVTLALTSLLTVIGDCAMHNFCNGHGSCAASTSTCLCYEGYGASTDLTMYAAPDCSARVCPYGKAWGDVPTSQTVAHQVAECSSRGTCDRSAGVCKCYPGYSGISCNRNQCPSDCSGHGICVSLKQMAKMSNALPLAPNTYYEGAEVFSSH